MTQPFIGQLQAFGFGFAPRNWAQCNGQTMAIQQNAALFALLGTMYGGNGTTTFQLPNLQARMPIHLGNGYTQGQVGGEVNHTLITSEMPQHNHTATGVTTAASSPAATNATWAASAKNPFAA